MIAFTADLSFTDRDTFAIVAATTTAETRTFPIPRETTALTHVPPAP